MFGDKRFRIDLACGELDEQIAMILVRADQEWLLRQLGEEVPRDVLRLRGDPEDVGDRSAITTAAPRRAASTPIAAPIPAPPPTTSIVLPSKFIAWILTLAMVATFRP